MVSRFSMVHYTNLNNKDLAEFSEAYNLGEVEDFEILEGGYTNSSYKLKTKTGEFILTICEDKQRPHIQTLINLLEYLNENNFLTNSIIPSIRGENLTVHKGNPVYVKTFVEGSIPKSISKELAYQIGQKIADLHSLVPPDDIPHNFPYGLKYFNEILDLDLKDPFVDWLKNQKEYLERSISKDLPRGLVHGDIFYDNLIQHNGELQAIIDFEEVSNYPFVFDIGMAIIGSCSRHGKVNWELANSLIDGYTRSRFLTKLEIENLKTFCIYGAVATAFWRFRQYHVRHPEKEKADRHQEMVKTADLLQSTDDREFLENLNLRIR